MEFRGNLPLSTALALPEHSFISSDAITSVSFRHRCGKGVCFVEFGLGGWNVTL